MTQPTPADFAAALSDGLTRQLLIRLQADTCDHCGRSGTTTAELELIRKYLADSEIKALQAGATQSILDADIALPFTAPLYLAETAPI